MERVSPVNTMGRSNNPSFVNQCASARDFLIEILSLNNGGLPGHLAIFGILATDNLR